MNLKLIVNWHSKTLVKSFVVGGTFTLPSFTEGDIVPFEVQIIEPDATATNRYTTPDISNVALSLTVEDSDGDPVFVSQPTWTKNVSTGTFTALVDFNTAALASWIGSSTTKDGVLKIKATTADGGVITIYQDDVTVVANLSGATPTNPLTGTTTLTLEAASAMFAKKMMDPGDTITFQTQDGSVGRTIGIKKDGDGNTIDIDYQYVIGT